MSVHTFYASGASIALLIRTGCTHFQVIFDSKKNPYLVPRIIQELPNVDCGDDGATTASIATEAVPREWIPSKS